MTLGNERLRILAEVAANISLRMSKAINTSFPVTAELRQETPQYWCQEVYTVLDTSLHDLRTLLQEFAEADTDELDEIGDEITHIGVSMAELRMVLLHSNFAPQQAELRYILLRLTEIPLFALLYLLQQTVLTHLDPWAICHDPEHPEVRVELDVNREEALQLLKQLRDMYAQYLPEGVVFTDSLFMA